MSTIVTADPNGERRIDLDWVRIIAFVLLIWYHVTCFYSSVTPHNQPLSPRTIPWLIVPMLALNPWRLLILFIVSGAATRFMADKMQPRALFWMRNRRLAPPVWFVAATIVPAYTFIAVRQWCGYPGSFASFLGHYFTFDRICQNPAFAPVPNYGHLWFVAYLWLYTLAVVGLIAYAPGLLGATQRGLERALRGWGVIVWPCAYLALTRVALERLFPEFHDLIHDWYSHAIYFGGFLLGFSLAKSQTVWVALERLGTRALIGALTSYGLIIAGAIMTLGADFDWAGKVSSGGEQTHQTWLMSDGQILFGIDQWLWIAAAFGFARRYLSERDGAVRRYLTDAIFPFYVIHQLTIQVGGYYLTSLNLNLTLEFWALIAATALSCILTYEIARRVAWLRPLFGLKTLHAPVEERAPSGAAFSLSAER
jgi:glucan biosynthesis protein C